MIPRHTLAEARRAAFIDRLNRRAAAVGQYLFALLLGMAGAGLLLAFLDRSIHLH